MKKYLIELDEKQSLEVGYISMEQANVEQALHRIFSEGNLLRDGNNFVGFIDHNYVFGYCYKSSLVVRSIDNNRKWMLAYVKSCFADVDGKAKPDIREVCHEFYLPGVKVTYGELPWGWAHEP